LKKSVLYHLALFLVELGVLDGTADHEDQCVTRDDEKHWNCFDSVDTAQSQLVFWLLAELFDVCWWGKRRKIYEDPSLDLRFSILTDDRKRLHNLLNHHVFSQLSGLCCVNDVKVEKSAESDDRHEAQQCKAVVEEFLEKFVTQKLTLLVSHPNTSSAPLNWRLSLVWHIFGFTDTLSSPVSERMNKTTSSLEQEAGRQTPQCTTVEFLIWKRENKIQFIDLEDILICDFVRFSLPFKWWNPRGSKKLFTWLNKETIGLRN
jgi:hypothetical protein